ncbi:hypothetical protein ACHAW5_006895 [Stephanodiscus triporus]|uniref:Uncharacterized protein n=1 Tax=Stephanodiscus triporus TaxID=2934178 RepID=A0ABD3PC44_9STRA
MAGAIGNGIIMVLSPAKTMDLRPLNRRDLLCHDGVALAEIVRLNRENDCRLLCDEAFSAMICDAMKGRTEAELRSMLNLSTKLSKVARRYWADFDLGEKEGGADGAASDADCRPAMFTFSGPAYQGLDPSTCDGKTMAYLASRLFIIDPVYGVLRAL